MIKAIRGAIQVERNCADDILDATRELLTAIMEANHLERAQVVSAFFTMTPDLNACYPARAARLLGWKNTALMCAVEIDVADALPRVIRVMLHCEMGRKTPAQRFVYLRGTEILRAA